MTFWQRLFIAAQYLTPQHCLSRLVGCLAKCKVGFIKNFLITQFAKRYRVNLDEAKTKNLTEFACFNAFFTRELEANARLIAPNANAVISPADGLISQIGTIAQTSLVQAKGRNFDLLSLLGGRQDLANEFTNGSFATIYLSPKDYHRVHMPQTGTLQSMTYIPGKLFSVNQLTAQNVPNLFARNERLVCVFAGAHGKFAVILVGAMIVAGIETVWSGQVAPIGKQILNWDYAHLPISLHKGDELGRFQLGSTVILLFAKDAINWLPEFEPNAAIKMGQQLGAFNA